MAKAKAFGRIARPDDRDQDYLLRAAVPAMLAAVMRPKRKTWYLPECLDQGSKPQCVGYAWKGFLLSRPKRRSQSTPKAIYDGAQRLDGIPGEDYEGTTVRGGAAYLKKEASLVGSYRWAFTLKDALDACGLAGPLVLGTDWYQGMMETDEEGIIRATGPAVGGHAYLLLGYDDRKGLALIQNSWGAAWGDNGRAFLPYEDLGSLIRGGGEACAALEK